MGSNIQPSHSSQMIGYNNFGSNKQPHQFQSGTQPDPQLTQMFLQLMMNSLAQGPPIPNNINFNNMKKRPKGLPFNQLKTPHGSITQAFNFPQARVQQTQENSASQNPPSAFGGGGSGSGSGGQQNKQAPQKAESNANAPQSSDTNGNSKMPPANTLQDGSQPTGQNQNCEDRQRQVKQDPQPQSGVAHSDTHLYSNLESNANQQPQNSIPSQKSAQDNQGQKKPRGQGVDPNQNPYVPNDAAQAPAFPSNDQSPPPITPKTIGGCAKKTVATTTCTSKSKGTTDDEYEDDDDETTKTTLGTTLRIIPAGGCAKKSSKPLPVTTAAPVANLLHSKSPSTLPPTHPPPEPQPQSPPRPDTVGQPQLNSQPQQPHQPQPIPNTQPQPSHPPQKPSTLHPQHPTSGPTILPTTKTIESRQKCVGKITLEPQNKPTPAGVKSTTDDEEDDGDLADDDVSTRPPTTIKITTPCLTTSEAPATIIRKIKKKCTTLPPTTHSTTEECDDGKYDDGE